MKLIKPDYIELIAIELSINIAQYLKQQKFVRKQEKMHQDSLLSSRFPDETSGLRLDMTVQKRTQKHYRIDSE